jgi:hypothetical protein
MKNTDMTNAERVVDALEAFVSAKCTYKRRILDDPDWATSRDVDENPRAPPRGARARLRAHGGSRTTTRVRGRRAHVTFQHERKVR